MSDNISIYEIESKLSLVVRKPQEGKTTICINSITNDKSKNIHIVLTMNTLSAGMQFFGRMQNEVGSKKIIVFNSKKQTAGDCYHAKTVTQIASLIQKQEDIKVIVCCAHEKRIREGIPDIFDFAADSIKMREANIKFVVHIDEAHKYIPENIKFVRQFNNCPIVSEIIGYSATHEEIFVAKNSDPMFHRILIRDVEAELGIIRSPNYFGVNRCQFNIYDELDHDELIEKAAISTNIPQLTIIRADMEEKNCRTWFGNRWWFDLGNEILLLSFIDFILPILKLSPDSFSYNFMPSYTRKATHYESMVLVLKHYPTANVIISNGNGYQLCRFRSATGKSCIVCDDNQVRLEAMQIQSPELRKKELDSLLEPSYMIQKLIKDTPNSPTFITGFTCVGMSVTLINQDIGNFDNVIMAHHHYSRDKLYQLCRFLCKYDSWTPENQAKIKTTQFHSLTKIVIDKCLDYEASVERACTEFAGKSCTLRELQGLEPEDPSERELKQIAEASIKLVNPTKKLWRKFKVYDGNDDEEWEKANNFYESIREKKITGVSMPKKNSRGFYESSDSHGLGVKTVSTFSSLEKEKWTNRFQLKKDCLSYARVFVGYDNLEHPNEYTIFIKFAQLEDTETTREFLSKYGINNDNDD